MVTMNVPHKGSKGKGMFSGQEHILDSIDEHFGCRKKGEIGMDDKWTPKMVAQRFEEAAKTLERLPESQVQQLRASWPPVVQEVFDEEGRTIPRGPPTGDAIDRMDETFTWLKWLEKEQTKLVWSKAEGMPWKLILRRLGVCRATAWQWWMSALTEVASRLNERMANKTV